MYRRYIGICSFAEPKGAAFCYDLIPNFLKRSEHGVLKLIFILQIWLSRQPLAAQVFVTWGRFIGGLKKQHFALVKKTPGGLVKFGTKLS